MLEREVKGIIEEDEMKILSDVYDINKLREWWMFLRKIEKLMKRTIELNSKSS